MTEVIRQSLINTDEKVTLFAQGKTNANGLVENKIGVHTTSKYPQNGAYKDAPKKVVYFSCIEEGFIHYFAELGWEAFCGCSIHCIKR